MDTAQLCIIVYRRQQFLFFVPKNGEQGQHILADVH